MTVSYIGYKTVDLSAAGQTFVKVVLQEDSKMIDEVVVVGYGVQSQKLVTTSISKVKMENIDQGNDYNPIKMLQGRVAVSYTHLDVYKRQDKRAAVSQLPPSFA